MRRKDWEMPEAFTTEFESAILRGRATEVTEENEKIHALRMLCERHTPTNMENFEESGFLFEGQILSKENSYQYGPVCIDKSVRGSGVFEKVFYASLLSMKEHYPIMATFINQINHRSYAAHTRKVAMQQVGTFQYNGNDYYLMSSVSDAPLR